MAMYRFIKHVAYDLFIRVENAMSSLDKHIRNVFRLDSAPQDNPSLLTTVFYTLFGELIEVPADFCSWMSEWWCSRCNAGTLCIATAAAILIAIVASIRRCPRESENGARLIKVGELLSKGWPLDPHGSHILYHFEQIQPGDPVEESFERLLMSTPRPHMHTRGTDTAEDRSQKKIY